MSTSNFNPDNRYRVFRGGAWVSTTVSSVRAAFRGDVAPAEVLAEVWGVRE